jgi:D-glycero-D-manno-heptose 1,7-bisphosphate phosphatase
MRGNPALNRAAVFLDRDGVLNRCYERDGVTHPPASVADLEILADVPDAVRRLAMAGFALVVVTNQPDVARGLQTREAVEEINERLRAELPLLDVRVCYHDSGDGCTCRKPKPGMLLDAAARWGIDLGRSFLVGDRWSDVAAGQAAGCRTVLLTTPHSGRERCRPDRCVENLAEAAEWILGLPGDRRHEAVC